MCNFSISFRRPLYNFEFLNYKSLDDSHLYIVLIFKWLLAFFLFLCEIKLAILIAELTKGPKSQQSSLRMKSVPIISLC